MTSQMITSGRVCRAFSIPSRPFSAVTTSNPSISSIRAMLRRIGVWSSIIRIFFISDSFLPTAQLSGRRSVGTTSGAEKPNAIGLFDNPTKVLVANPARRSMHGHMTADQTYLLRKTFDLVERNAQVAALVFYRRLFEL